MTLIELIVFIVIVSVALAGVLTVLNITAKSSADPMIRKQMLVIAEALLEEVQLQPFTWCDPDDLNAATATSSASCTGGTNGASDESKLPLGPEAAESRSVGSVTPFDNVSDYNGLATAASVSGTVGTGMPAGYSAAIAVANDASFGVAGSFLTSSAVLRITVTVTYGADSIVLEAYRTRHSPNFLP
jgi:MSHA pilin protein MshD